MALINLLTAVLAYVIALCGIVPLFPWLELIPRFMLVICMVIGVWQSCRGGWPLKNWMVNTAIVPVFLYYALQFSRTNPVQPVVSVLAIMLAVRLGGLKNSRHYLQITALSLFCLAASSLFDLSPLFLLYLALILLLVPILLLLLIFYSHDESMFLNRADLRRVLVAGLLLPLFSIPLLIFFFPLLPRTQIPLWNFLSVPASRTSGFSDSVEPGSSSSMSAARVLAFRAEMSLQPQQNLYWRGTVFNKIDGRRWERVVAPSENLINTGSRISQTIYPEPGLSRFLLALDAPVSLILPRSRRSSDGVYEYQGSGGKRLVYTAESISSGKLVTVGNINRSFYLTLPKTLSERIKQLGANIQRQADSDIGRLGKLEIFFRNAGFRYSMTGLPTGERALEQFLFESKQGNCEFFASSFAQIMRSAGVPARLVGGYLGGEYNQLGGYYQVSEDMAHVWVEVYITGQGWLRVDPSSLAKNAGAVWAIPPKSLLFKIRMTLDSLNHTWNRAIITYDFERQVNVARKVGTRLQGFEAGRAVKVILQYLVGVFVVMGLSALVVYRKQLFPTREERLLRRFYLQIRRDCKIEVDRGNVGLFEIADRVDNPAIHEFVNIYAGSVYRDKILTDDEYKRLRQMVCAGFR